MLPVGFSLQYGVIDTLLGNVLLLAKAGNKLSIMGVPICDGVQFFDGSIGDALGQGRNSLRRKSVGKVGEEVEGAFQLHDGDFGELHDIGQHLEVNLGSKASRGQSWVEGFCLPQVCHQEGEWR